MSTRSSLVLITALLSSCAVSSGRTPVQSPARPVAARPAEPPSSEVRSLPPPAEPTPEIAITDTATTSGEALDLEIADALQRLSERGEAIDAKGVDPAWLRIALGEILEEIGDPPATVPQDGLVDAVRRCLDWLVTENKGRPWLLRSLARKDRWSATVRATFAERQLPPLLDDLALVESGYEARAYSRVGAAGMWQFMPATGRRYALRVDRRVDERLDPLRATVAAREYLLDLILEFGSGQGVLLAMAAYNAGEGRIRERLRRLEDYRVRSFWTLAERGLIPEETRLYVPMILAASLASRNRARFDLPDPRPYAPVMVATAPAPPPTTPPREAPQRAVAVARAPAPAARPKVKPQPPPLRYVVQSGNSPHSIAAAFGLSPDVVVRAAGGGKKPIVPGQVVELPLKGWERKLHKVAKGESLERIARAHKTSPRALLTFNGLATSRIRAGELIAIYAPRRS